MTFENPPEVLHDFYMAGDGNDGKDLIDAQPRRPLEIIAADYQRRAVEQNFDWNQFYQNNFTPPERPAAGLRALPGRTIEQHVESMWSVLSRDASADGYTLLGQPNMTVVPGERFSESYYWDSYFTMRGLAAAGKWNIVEGMVNNCAHQIDRFGYVPNGSRTYYLGRSQPPVFSHMVQLLAKHKEQMVTEQQLDAAEGYGAVMVKYLPHMLREHNFWMDGSDDLLAQKGGQTAAQRVVLMPDGSLLNRYYDANSTPRPESYRQDIISASGAGIEQLTHPHEFYRNIRAAAESGWDFSGRWCDDGKTLKTISTTNIVPIDLNSLLYDLELSVSAGFESAGEPARAAHYRAQAEQRAAAINRYCWDPNKGFYYDYHTLRGEHTDYPTMAAAFALHSGIPNQHQADAVASVLESKFLLSGGFATSLQETAEQWDGENGWAPSQVIACLGLKKYGHTALAAKASGNWKNRNAELFDQSRQLHEKIQVGDKVAAGDGGEYPGQTGFAWTNGSLLDLAL